MTDLLGVAAVITASGIFIVTVGTAIVGWRKLKDTHRMVGQIDLAVNGKAPGETTMVSQVQDLHDQLPEPEPFTNGSAILPLLKRLAIDVAELKKQGGVI